MFLCTSVLCYFENFWINCVLWLLLFHQHPLFGGVGVLDPAKVFCSSFYHLVLSCYSPVCASALTNAHISGASAINFLRAVEFLSLSVIFPFFLSLQVIWFVYVTVVKLMVTYTLFSKFMTRVMHVSTLETQYIDAKKFLSSVKVYCVSWKWKCYKII